MAAAARRGRQRRRSSKGGRRRLLVGLAVLSLVAAGIAGVAIVGAAVGPKIIRSRCDLSSLRQINIGSNSFVTASDNSLLGTIPAKKNRQQSLAIRWILEGARGKKGKPMAKRLAEELFDAFNKQGSAYTKRENTHKMAEANEAFAHFAW